MNLSVGRTKKTLSQQPYVATPETAMQSILIDMMHYCDATGTHDFETELEAARCTFERETCGDINN